MSTVRRTSTVDMVWTDPRDPMKVDDSGAILRLRSVVRDPTGTRVVTAGMGKARELVWLQVDGESAGQELVGVFLGAGFRSAALTAFPGTEGTILGAALDDLPVAALISMYAIQRTAALDLALDDEAEAMHARRADVARMREGALAHMVDMCAGWDGSGETVARMRTGEHMPLQECPVAAELDDGWHPMPELDLAQMRRHRSTQVHGDGRVEAMFRDVFVDPDGSPRVLHEYDVTATVKAGRVIDAVATPIVLPFTDCRRAAASAQLLRGLPVVEISGATRKAVIGTAGCTHLTDCLRQLEAVPQLVELLSE